MTGAPDDGLVLGPDGRKRCFWCGATPDYLAYHDEEWGFPVSDERRLFEKLCLEGFQSGLSWLTILRKRPAFRRAFASFDPAAIASFGPAEVEVLLQDAGIVRHRGKIESVLNNARRALDLAAEGISLAGYLWSFEPVPASRPALLTREALSALTLSPESTALSKALKKQGWSYVGPTTVYAFMQAVGLVNDHVEGCSVRPAVEKAREAFRRPQTGGAPARAEDP